MESMFCWYMLINVELSPRSVNTERICIDLPRQRDGKTKHTVRVFDAQKLEFIPYPWVKEHRRKLGEFWIIQYDVYQPKFTKNTGFVKVLVDQKSETVHILSIGSQDPFFYKETQSLSQNKSQIIYTYSTYSQHKPKNQQNRLIQCINIYTDSFFAKVDQSLQFCGF